MPSFMEQSILGKEVSSVGRCCKSFHLRMILHTEPLLAGCSECAIVQVL